MAYQKKTKKIITTLILAIVGLGGIFWTLSANNLISRPKDITLEKEGAKMLIPNNKTLVVYFTRSGKTSQVANWIRETANADLIELKLVTPYPESYNDVVDQAKKEINSQFRPELATKIDNFAQYETIYVGTPNWWSTMAPPVATFLTSYDFSNKTIIPFVTHGGGGVAACASDMKKLTPKATHLEPLVIRDRQVEKSKSQVVDWTQKSLSKKI